MSLTLMPSADWPCPNLTDDRREARNVWRIVTEDFFNQMLEVMPPRCYGLQCGAFMVGEAHDHNNGEWASTCVCQVRGVYYAKIVDRSKLDEEVEDLAKHAMAQAVAEVG